MKKNSDVIKLGLLWVLIGTLVILLIETIKHGSDLTRSITEVLSQLGTALVGVGIVAIILEFEDWKKYFQSRLKEVVIEKSYLETLSEDELTNLQVNALKAKYKSTDIDKEGSFLHYIQNKVQDYICFPYRDNIVLTIQICEDEDNIDKFIVYDNISYYCRSVADKIQESIGFTYEENEFEVKDINIKIQCPSNKMELCNEVCVNSKICEDSIVNLNKKELDNLYKADKKSGYMLDIKKIIKPQDKLHVELNAVYTIDRESMFTWAMTHPSKNISMTINYPNKYEINLFIGGLEPKEYSYRKSGQVCIFTHEGWFLPRTGFAWNLVKKI